MALAFKDLVDTPRWVQRADLQNADSGIQAMLSDTRRADVRHPFAFRFTAGLIYAYSPAIDNWLTLVSSTGLGTTVSSSWAAVLAPSAGPRGTLSASATNTDVVLSTALPAAVGVNQLANRGDGSGFTIRVIGKTAGKTEERVIVANTAGTTPTVTLASALSFVPSAGDLYEIRSGVIYMMGEWNSAPDSTHWRKFDIATGAVSGLSAVNLPSANNSGAPTLTPMSEDFVPTVQTVYGGGIYGVMSAQSSGASTLVPLTGVLPSSLAANEYRNFQLRIVEDLVTPSSVGQRVRIASHTSGSTPTFTLYSSFSTQPSSSCKFVLEYDDDKIVVKFPSVTTTYTYNIGSDAWDTTTFVSTAAPSSRYVAVFPHGVTVDAARNTRHSFLFLNAASGFEILDIAGSSTGSVAAIAAFGNGTGTVPDLTGGSYAYDPIGLGGRYLYGFHGSSVKAFRIDLANRVVEMLRRPTPATIIPVGSRKVFMTYGVNGAEILPFFNIVIPNAVSLYSLPCFR